MAEKFDFDEEINSLNSDANIEDEQASEDILGVFEEPSAVSEETNFEETKIKLKFKKTEEKIKTDRKKKSGLFTSVDKMLVDEAGDENHTYTGEGLTERDYLPVRGSREYRSGCLGGIMYFTFIACISVLLAVLMWMAASDALALNVKDFTESVTLSNDIFTAETVAEYDSDGVLTGTKNQSVADIDKVADLLHDAGLVQYKSLFKFFCKISHASRKLDPGTYELKSSYDYRALIKNMQKGAGGTFTVTVTIPEGFTMHQIFMRLEENNVCSYEALMDAAANYKFNYSFIDEESTGNASRLEGFLFPDTYEFYVEMEASSAITKFLDNFNYRQTEEIKEWFEQSNVSVHDVVTMASLIEKEAANNDERALIASVINNRLKSGMTLGLESALLYMHPDHEGAPTPEMYEEDSPYNLMLNKGLPPTPISNPGLASIYAVLNPGQTNYYYFTLDTATGTHRFFTDYNDFLNFVNTQNYE